MDSHMLKAIEPKETVGTSRRGRLYATERDIKELFGRFLLPSVEGPRYAFRTADGTVVTIYRREDTAEDECEVGAFYWTALAPDIVNSGREEQGSISV